jgi:hypothetical protein
MNNKNLFQALSHIISVIYHPCNISLKTKSFKENNETKRGTETSIKIFITRRDVVVECANCHFLLSFLLISSFIHKLNLHHMLSSIMSLPRTRKNVSAYQSRKKLREYNEMRKKCLTSSSFQLENCWKL